MAEDVRDQADQELAEFQQFVDDCRGYQTALAQDVEAAEHLLDAVAQRSRAFRSAAVQRIATLRQGIDEVRSEFQSQLSAVEGRSLETAQHARQAAETFRGRIDEMASRLAELRGRLESAGALVETGVEAVSQRAGQLDSARQQMVQRLLEQKANVEQTTETRVENDAARHIQTFDTEADRFESEFRNGFDRAIEAGSRQFVSACQATVSQLEGSATQLVSEFEQTVERTLQQFAEIQAQQVQALQRTMEQTRNTVTSVADAFDSHAAEFETATENVNDAMHQTQVGLKVTVGTLEKVKSILEEIRL